MQQPQAGIVGIDVLAVRTGMGGIKVPGSPSGVASALCKVWTCANDDMKSIDFTKPPRGYDVSPPQSSTLTISGQIPMQDGVSSIAERGLGQGAGAAAHPATPPKFPARTEFALVATLRAGALISRSGLFRTRVDSVVPINTYAQYVVRFTVATFPGQRLVSTDTPIVPSPSDLAVVTVPIIHKSLSQKIGEWIRDNFALSSTIVLVVFVALLLFVPGFRSLMSAVLGLFAQMLRAIVRLFGSKPAG
jgi:hypothetical protein